MLSTADFRKGGKIVHKGDPFEIIDFQHVKMGRGGAVVKTRLKSMKTGSVLEETFRSGDKFDLPQLEEKTMQYLYNQDDLYYFMDMESYEQIPLSKDQLGDTRKFVKENMNVTVMYYKGTPMSVAPPMFVELQIAETEPSYKGDTASGGSKPAKLETGAVVKVPFHIQTGDIIRIDTRTADYIEKVK